MSSALNQGEEPQGSSSSANILRSDPQEQIAISTTPVNTPPALSPPPHPASAALLWQQHSDLDFGMDIGGTLSKLVYFERTGEEYTSGEEGEEKRKVRKFITSSLHYGETGERDPHFETFFPVLGGKLHFIKFQTQRMDNFAKLLIDNKLIAKDGFKSGATGGGAHKFEEKFRTEIGIQLLRFDEMSCLLKGINFLLRYFEGECYYFEIFSMENMRKKKLVDAYSGTDKASFAHSSSSPSTTTPSLSLIPSSSVSRSASPSIAIPANSNTASLSASSSPMLSSTPPLFPHNTSEVLWGNNMYPYLVVNIGSGVSILKVNGEDSFQRVGGTSLGGSTFFGLCTLLTGCKSFKEALQLAEKGNHQNVDMLVKDIYGGHYKTFNLPADTIASSFGKITKSSHVVKDSGVTTDPTNSTSATTTTSPSQEEGAVRREDLARSTLMTITNNIASIAHLHAQLHGVTKILFAGNFLARNDISRKMIAYGLNYWSQGKIKALFLEHEGYFGAIGALLFALENSSVATSASPSPSPSSFGVGGTKMPTSPLSCSPSPSPSANN